MTELESTSRRKRCAREWSSVTIESVWAEPCVAMWSIASSRPSTTRMDRIGARYSVSQSSGVAASQPPTSCIVAGHPLSSTPASRYRSASGGSTSGAMARSTSSVSMVQQVP